MILFKKKLPEEKLHDGLPEVSGDYSSISPLFTDRYFQMYDVNVWNNYINIHILSQHDLDFKHGDVSCENGFMNFHNISQCNDSSSFKDMDGDVEYGDISGVHGSMNIYNLY